MLLPVLSPCLVLACLITIVRTELFTSIADLEKVLYSEKEVVDQLREYADKEEQKIKEIRRIADDYEMHSQRAMSHGVHSYMTNPLNAYLLVRKLTAEWTNNVVSILQTHSGEEFLSSIQESLTFFPTQEDLTGAAMALLRLQDTYALSTEEIAQGNLLGVKDSPPLSANECFDIAKQAYFHNDYYHAIPWLRQSMEILEAENPKSADKSLILDFLAFATYMQGNVRAALNLTEEWIKLKPHDNDRAYINRRNYEDLLRKSGEPVDYTHPAEIKNEQVLDDWHGSPEFKDYESLCRGEDIGANNNKSNKDLKCRLRRHHPIYMLRPLKEEQVSQDPNIWIMHDVITDQEIARMKELSMPLLHRSGIFSYINANYKKLQESRVSKSSTDQVSSLQRVKAPTCKNIAQAKAPQVSCILIKGPGQPPYGFSHQQKLHRSGVFTFDGASHGKLQDYRTSKSAWLSDSFDPMINRVSQKVRVMCNLTLENVEDWQVLNYGIGGHYEPHYDFARDWETNTFQSGIGNRIATNICYLSDVLRGGRTVFTTLGIKVEPEKGSCALWYNMKRNGKGDFNTKHAGCPVLAGDKWVANKWFHERGQEFIRPCVTDPNL